MASVSPSARKPQVSLAAWLTGSLTRIDTASAVDCRTDGETMPDGLRETTLLHWRILIDMPDPRELNWQIDEIFLASSGDSF